MGDNRAQSRPFCHRIWAALPCEHGRHSPALPVRGVFVHRQKASGSLAKSASKSGETMNPVCRTPLCARPESTVPSRFFCHRQHVPQTGKAAQKMPVANRLSFILPPLAARWMPLSAPEPRSKNNLPCAATRVYTRIKNAFVRPPGIHGSLPVFLSPAARSADR